MAQLVSDEVWRQLDPYAGRLPGRTVWRLRFAILGGTVLSIAVGLVWWSGVIVPRIGWTNDAGYGWSAGPEQVTFEAHLRNEGLTPAEVIAVGRSGPGFELQSVQGTVPTTLAPGQSLVVVLVYRVTDCGAVPADPWPVPVRVRRPWGEFTSYVPLPTQTSHSAPNGMRNYTGRDPYAIEWQRELADDSCDPTN